MISPPNCPACGGGWPLFQVPSWRLGLAGGLWQGVRRNEMQKNFSISCEKLPGLPRPAKTEAVGSTYGPSGRGCHLCDKATLGSSPCVASSQQKERDAAHADRPCPTVHDSIVARWNVLWCPDFYFSGAFFSGPGWGCFFWGSHAAPQTGSDLWPRYAVLSTCVPWCPRLSAPVRICPSAMGGHAPWPLCSCSAGWPVRLCKFPALPPCSRRGCLFWGSHA